MKASTTTWALASVLSCCSLVAEAQVRTADLELTAAIAESTLAPLATTSLSVTLTNRGPDALTNPGAPSVITSEYQFGGLGENVSIGSTAETAPCSYSVDVLLPVPGNAYSSVGALNFGDLAAGESRTCRLLVAAQWQGRGMYVLTVRVPTSTPRLVDPNPLNNRFETRISLAGFPAVSVPTLGSIGRYALIALALIVGLWRLAHATHRNHRSHRRDSVIC